MITQVHIGILKNEKISILQERIDNLRVTGGIYHVDKLGLDVVMYAIKSKNLDYIKATATLNYSSITNYGKNAMHFFKD